MEPCPSFVSEICCAEAVRNARLVGTGIADPDVNVVHPFGGRWTMLDMGRQARRAPISGAAKKRHSCYPHRRKRLHRSTRTGSSHV